jgi:hypothetical protein
MSGHANNRETLLKNGNGSHEVMVGAAFPTRNTFQYIADETLARGPVRRELMIELLPEHRGSLTNIETELTRYSREREFVHYIASCAFFVDPVEALKKIEHLLVDQAQAPSMSGREHFNFLYNLARQFHNGQKLDVKSMPRCFRDRVLIPKNGKNPARYV